MGLQVLTQALTSVTEASVGVSVHFEQMTQQIQANTGLSDQAIAQMGTVIQTEMGKGTASMDQLGEGLMHVANFGFKTAADQALILDSAMKSATSTGGNTAATANLLAAAMHEYGAGADEAAKYTDILHTAAQRGNATFEQFAESSARAVGTAANLHVPIEQVASALSALTQHGYNAAEAQTQVVNIMTHLIHPSAAAADELARVSKITGVDLVGAFSAAGLSTNGLTGTMDLLHQAYSKLGLSEADAAAETMTLLNAQRGGLGMMTLLGTGAEDYKNNLTAMSAVISGNATPTEDAYQKALETTAYKQGELSNKVELLGKKFGDELTPGINSALDSMTRLADSPGAAATLTGLGTAMAGLTANFGAGIETIGNAGGTLEKFNAILVVTANNTAAQLGLMSQAEADAANRTAVANAQRAADYQTTGQHIATTIQVGNQAVLTGQDAFNVELHNHNVAAAADGLALWSAHARNLDDQIPPAMQNAGTDAGGAYLQGLTTGHDTGMPAVDARIHDLLAAHNITEAMALMGKADADSFHNALLKGIVNSMEAAATAMEGIPGVGAQTAMAIRLSMQGIMTQIDGTAAHADLVAAQAEQKADAAAALRESKAAAAAGRAAAAHARSLASHEAALAKHADVVDAQMARISDSVITGLGKAAEQAGVKATGISESISTLIGLADDSAKVHMTGVHDSIVNLLEQARSKTPPTTQAIHDSIVQQLQLAAQSGDAHMRDLATNALRHLQELEAGTEATMERASATATTKAGKLKEGVLQSLQQLAGQVAEPTGTTADLIVQMMDLANAAADAKMPALHDAIVTQLEKAKNGGSVSLHDLRVVVDTELSAAQASGDGHLAAFAASVDFHLGEAETKAAEHLTKMNADAAAKTAQLNQTLIQGLGTAVAGMQTQSANIPAFLQQALAVANAATAAGMGQVADTMIAQINRAASGDAAALGSLNSTLLSTLQSMAQSTDLQTRLMAQTALQHFDEMAAGAQAKTDQMAATTAANMQKTRDSVITNLGQAAAGAFDGTKSITDTLITLMPLAAQAADAGMQGVSDAITGWLAQAAAGTPPPMDTIYSTITSLLQAAQADGNQSTALFATQALQHLDALKQGAAEKMASVHATICNETHAAATCGTGAMQDLKTNTNTALDGLHTETQTKLGQTTQTVADLMNGMTRETGGALNRWHAAFTDAAGNILTDVPPPVAQAGQDAIQGLTDALHAGVGPVSAASAELGNAAESGLRRAIQAESPSKAFYAAGVDMWQGLLNGGESMQGAVATHATGMGASVVAAFAAAAHPGVVGQLTAAVAAAAHPGRGGGPTRLTDAEALLAAQQAAQVAGVTTIGTGGLDPNPTRSGGGSSGAGGALGGGTGNTYTFNFAIAPTWGQTPKDLAYQMVDYIRIAMQSQSSLGSRA